MKIVTIIARILLGLAFTVFGANIIHPFMPMPPPVEGSPIALFMAVMLPSGWMTLVGIIQLIGGLLVLSARATPLGLVFLAPILVNILAFHITLDHGNGIGGGIVFSVLEIFLIYAYRNNFRGIFACDASPS